MRKSTVISLIALLVSIVGLLIALIAYFKRRSCALCDDLDDALMEYYDEDDEDCLDYNEFDRCCGEFVVTDGEDEETSPEE